MRRYRIEIGKKAAAVAYTPDDPAPLLLAAGTAGLVSLLQAVKPGDYIPSWCWEAMAKILAFVLTKENESLKKMG